MSYYPDDSPRASSVHMSAEQLHDCLNYNRLQRPLELPEESRPGQDGLAPMHPGYVPWPHYRPRRRNYSLPHLHLPVNSEDFATEEAAIYPGYGPWPQRSWARRNHYHPHVHRPTELRNLGAYDSRWPAIHGTSGADHQHFDEFPAAELPAPAQPYPDPPVRPPPPPSVPRPRPQPRPRPRPIPGPKRPDGRESTIPEYFAPCAASDSGYQTGHSAGRSQSPTAQSAETGSVNIETPQPVAFRCSSVEDADSDSEGSRTPTQDDYSAKESGSQSDISAQKAHGTNDQGPASTVADKDEAQPAYAPQKAEPQNLRARRRQRLSNWQRRSQHGRVPREFPYWKADEADRLAYDRSTGRFEAVGDAVAKAVDMTAEESAMAAKGAIVQGGGDEQGQTGKYDFQVPRSPN